MGEAKYNRDRARQGYRLALLGHNDVEIAEVMGVTDTTIQRWKKEYPFFAKQLQRGKDDADARVAQSLYQRAIGYSHPDVHISNFKGEITVTPITKHYPPDTAAAIKWLEVRQGKKWGKVEKGDGIAKKLIMKIDLTKCTMEELQMAKRLGLMSNTSKQLLESGSSKMNVEEVEDAMVVNEDEMEEDEE